MKGTQEELKIIRDAVRAKWEAAVAKRVAAWAARVKWAAETAERAAVLAAEKGG